MSYILGTHFQPNTKVLRSLIQLFGIGRNKALQICDQLGISDTIKGNQLTRIQLDQLMKIISQHYLIDTELKRIISNDIQRYIAIGAYRGLRHNNGLPVRGQRSHTNAKTCRKTQKGVRRLEL
uniref:Small ribosomal subunit protein uS13m n=1 Tax=Zygnema circumcarinatum TaxID=35869 RepID=A0A6N0GXK8_ZYGCR|nr:ribosomal protein S13 [Zygnema circumcarinatum]QKQ14719.1 ribosomal protein S13 [Zygnema circumcarinatum]WEL36363.1 ribosomal protein S13 [Zygnema circumcarinatum]